MMLEVRYVGSKGTKLLESRAFNQGYDLNAADTPDYIFERFNQAYVAAGSPNGALNAGSDGAGPRPRPGVRLPEQQRRRDGRLQPGQHRRRRDRLRGTRPDPRLQHPRSGAAVQYRPLDLQLAAVQPREADVTRACSSTSRIHSRARRTPARSIPEARPAAANRTCPNAGLRRRRAISAISTRTTRCRTSIVRTASAAAGCGTCRGAARSAASVSRASCSCSRGCRYSIYLGRTGAGQRESVRRPGSRIRRHLSPGVRTAEPVRLARRAASGRRRSDGGRVQQERALLAVDGRGRVSGQSGLRQPRPQRAARLLAAAGRPEPGQELRFGGTRNVELRWDVFNVLNTVNYALPNNVIGSASTDFGKITDSVGGPRVMQLGARVRF